MKKAADLLPRFLERVADLPRDQAAVGFDPVPSLARAAEILAAEDEALEASVAEHADAANLDLRQLQSQPLAGQRRLLRRWLRRRTGSEIDYDTVERARLLALATTPPAKMNLPRGRHLRRRGGQLFVS
jgi:hypothetical protein